MAPTKNLKKSHFGKRWFPRKLFLILGMVFVAFVAYLVLDYYGPAVIVLQEDTMFGVPGNTGDGNEESMIVWTDDGGKTLNPIGKGDQRWRVTQLAFTENALFWGADTRNTDESGIYRWDRQTHRVAKLAGKTGVIMYATRLAAINANAKQ